MRVISFLFIFLTSSFLYSQEICNNGIDDDGNGLIDLNDPACHCSPATTTTTVPSLIPNPSFETTACCPSSYSQLNCAQGWIQASSATSDYMNTCGFMPVAATSAGLVPLPDGNGMVGFISSVGYQEYVGSCLTSPMVAGTPYQINMSIASTPADGQLGVCNGGVVNYAPMNLTIWGATSCASMPFSGYLCPPAPWVILGSTPYNPVPSWSVATISFTPATNINAIIIGSPCTLDPSYNDPGGCYPYTYLDNLILNQTSAFTPTSLTQTGTWCNNNIQLTTPGVTGGSYQWYLNGVALVGQTGLTLNVSANSLPAGTYQLITTTGAWSTCQRDSSIVTASPPTSPTITPAGPFCINGTPSTLTASVNGGTWSGPGITNPATGAFNPALAGAGNNTITYTTTGICGGTATSVIVVNPLPTITTSITTNPMQPPVAANSATICIGQQTATLTAGGASSYTWNPAATLSSATGVTVTGSPPITTDYTVTGTSAAGCTNTETFTITVNPLPLITVNSSTICSGLQTATLTATNAVTYTWTPSATLSSNTGTSVMGTPTVTTDYTVTGTDANGCWNTATATVTVNPGLNITVNTSTICLGEQTATLTAGGATNYTWTPSATLSSNTGTTITGTPTITTDYTVTGGNAGGCFGIATTTITVNPLPLVSVNNATICVGQQTATLTANNAITYTWIPSATLSNNTGTSVTGTPTVTTDYTVTGTDANSCFNSATFTITVNPLPLVTVNSSTICVGQQTATLSATNAVTYTWNPSASLSNNIGTSVTGTPVTTTDYTVTGIDAKGCINTATFTITVNPLPLVTVNSSTICLGQQTATLTASGTATYSWTPSATLSSNSGATVTGTPSTTTNYTVTGTDAKGCFNTAISVITVNQLPPVSVNSATICLGEQIANLTAANAVTYTWNPSATLSNNTGTSVTGTPVTTTNYTVTGTDANNCVNAATFTITVNPLPVVQVNKDTICIEQQFATLSASGASTYMWTPLAGLSSNVGTSVTGFPTTSTNYTVIGTDVNGCISTATTSIMVYQLPVVSAGIIKPSCVPLCTSFTSTCNPPASKYTWNFDNGQSPISTNLNPPSSSFITATCFTVAQAYNITLSVTDINGCVNTASTSAVAYPIPVADFEYQPQPVTIIDPQVQFGNQSSPANLINNYNWNFGDVYSTNNASDLVNPSHTYLNIGTYSVTLTVTTVNSCTATITKPLEVKDSYVIYVPNAFSPNGDGNNEIFKALGEGINGFKLYVFDRWGNNLFYSDDINAGWDGRYLARGSQIVQEDVYVWLINLTDINNTAHSLHGTVTLLK